MNLEKIEIGRKFFIGENFENVYMKVACRINGNQFDFVVNVDTGMHRSLTQSQKNDCVLE